MKSTLIILSMFSVLAANAQSGASCNQIPEFRAGMQYFDEDGEIEYRGLKTGKRMGDDGQLTDSEAMLHMSGVEWSDRIDRGLSSSRASSKEACMCNVKARRLIYSWLQERDKEPYISLAKLNRIGAITMVYGWVDDGMSHARLSWRHAAYFKHTSGFDRSTQECKLATREEVIASLKVIRTQLNRNERRKLQALEEIERQGAVANPSLSNSTDEQGPNSESGFFSGWF